MIKDVYNSQGFVALRLPSVAYANVRVLRLSSRSCPCSYLRLLHALKGYARSPRLDLLVSPSFTRFEVVGRITCVEEHLLLACVRYVHALRKRFLSLSCSYLRLLEDQKILPFFSKIIATFFAQTVDKLKILCYYLNKIEYQ